MEFAKQKLTVITASYNYENYIKETIESVINQTYTNWEMIIVDDGSTDNSVEVIKSYCEKDSRIKLYQHPDRRNKGLVETLKLGLSKAETDWVIFLESDDTITPDYMEKKLAVAEQHPEVEFIYNDVNMYGNQDRIDEMNDAYFQYFYKIMESKVFPANMSKEFQERNIVPTFSCVMIQKSLFNNVLWDARCNNYLDYYLWVQIAKKTDFYYINEKLTNWRMHKNSYINRDLSDFDKEYFYNVQICGIINNKSALEKKILTLLIYLKQIQKQIIRFKLSPKESYLIVFGKTLFKREKSE